MSVLLETNLIVSTPPESVPLGFRSTILVGVTQLPGPDDGGALLC